MEEKIFVAGFGGQGVVVAGNILAHAALEEGRYILGMVSYGIEVRGGASHSFVIISDQEIDCPIIEDATIGFALSQEAYERFRGFLRKDGVFFIDSSQVAPLEDPGTKGKLIALPATVLAKEMGNEKVANMIMLGAAIEETGIVKLASAVKALGKVFKGLRKDLIYVNEKALSLGAELIRQHLLRLANRPASSAEWSAAIKKILPN